MNLTPAELEHLRYLVEELLFRLPDDEYQLIIDLEDEIRIAAEILKVDPNVQETIDEELEG